MRIRKFVAATMKEALDEVKRELGPDAMIVGTKPVRRGLLGQGVEVTAAVDQLEGPLGDNVGASFDDDMGGPTSMAGEERMSSGPRGAYGRTPSRNTNAYSAPAKNGLEYTGPSFNAQQNVAPAPSAGLTDVDLERIMNPLRAELRAMTRRNVSAANAGGSDNHALESLRREVGALQSMVARIAAPKAPETVELESISSIARDVNLISNRQGRVTALVGPTGVGKTTTLAKLAARAALVEKRRVGIITMDTFRIGAEEQIRAYADLIGVPLVQCSEPARLPEALRRLTTCERVFIDTPGYGPREEEALKTLGAALKAASEIGGLDVHLVMPASSSGSDIDRAAHRFSATGCNRLLFSKLDEAAANEELVRAPARLGLPVRYLATGQRVPEDLEDASLERLLDLAERGLDLAEAA